jgi:3-hydroxyisobutyrate dehydrogenase
MGLASHVAEQYDSPLPLGEAAKDIYDEVSKSPELANKDFSAVYRFLQKQSNH